MLAPIPFGPISPPGNGTLGSTDRPQRMNPRSKRERSRRRAWLAALLLLAGCGQTAFEPPLPPDLDALDPELGRLAREHAAKVRADPENALAVATLALVYESNRLWPQAQACYERAASLDASEPAWPYHAAMTRMWGNDFAGASDAADMLRAKFPQFAPAHFLRGDLALEQGDFELARACLERAAQLAPGAPQPRAALGDALLRRGDAQAAVRELEAALTIDPEFGSARHLLGSALLRLGESERASSEFAAKTQERPRMLGDAWSERAQEFSVLVEVRVERALKLMDQNRVEEAVQLLELARRTRPGELQVLVNLGIAYLRLGKQEAAQDALEAALRLAPDDFRVHLNLAGLHFSAQRFELARQAALRAASISPAVAQAHFLAGKSAIELELWDPGLASLREARRLEPANVMFLREFASAARRAGQLQEARSTFEELAKLAPASWQPLAELARVCAQQGDWSAARDAIGRARAIAPQEAALAALEAEFSRREQGR